MSSKHFNTIDPGEENESDISSATAYEAAAMKAGAVTQPDTRSKTDDLLRIKGVTKEVEQALKKVGINTYEKLASYNAGRLSNILKANDPPISLSQVKLETIVNKARDFSQQRQKQERAQTMSEAASTGRKKKQYERHWENWEELADFFVSFGYEITKSGDKILQTRVINYGRDEKQQWQDVATDQLLEWIISRSNTPLAAEGQSETPVAEEAKILALAEPVVSEISYPPTAETPEWRSRRLCVESYLKLSEAELAKRSYDKLIALIEIYLLNQQTQQHKLAAYQTCQYTPGNLTYEIKQDFSIPETGKHQLYLAARLFPLGDTTYVEGPVICVEG